MRTFKFLSLISFLSLSFLLSAQTQVTKQTQQKGLQQTPTPVAPTIVKKLPEKQQAMYDQMAKDLELTDVNKAKVIELAIERSISLSEKLKAATTDEQKAELKKASSLDYNKKLDDAFTVEKADKIRAWQKEYTLKQKAEQSQTK